MVGALLLPQLTPSVEWFPDGRTRILVGPGENAGVVDLGDGHRLAFKIESHNHPSAVEPFQGAATGVGGILRDIFTMGARPIALLNALRFGPLEEPATRGLVEGLSPGFPTRQLRGVPTVGVRWPSMPPTAAIPWSMPWPWA